MGSKQNCLSIISKIAITLSNFFTIINCKKDQLYLNTFAKTNAELKNKQLLEYAITTKKYLIQIKQLLMNEITTILTWLHSLLDRSTYRQLLVINQSLLVMTGRVTMLGISRWAEPGESYRTMQRFFTKDIRLHSGQDFECISPSSLVFR